jgi:hypothetical protein
LLLAGVAASGRGAGFGGSHVAGSGAVSAWLSGGADCTGFGNTLIDQPRTLARLEAVGAWSPEQLADAFGAFMAKDVPPQAAIPFACDVDRLPAEEWQPIDNERRYWRRSEKPT